MAVFWLAASSAWANGVVNMKSVADPTSWIYKAGDLAPSICEKASNGNFKNTVVKDCVAKFTGNFAKANVSIVSTHNTNISTHFKFVDLLSRKKANLEFVCTRGL